TRALKLGFKLSEYGVFDHAGRRIAGATEEEVYRAIGLPLIPPELREGRGEVQAALEGRLPKLLAEADLRGDLHVHSKASSDGKSDLDELRAEAARLRREYVAITDHSRARPLGLTPDARARTPRRSAGSAARARCCSRASRLTFSPMGRWTCPTTFS